MAGFRTPLVVVGPSGLTHGLLRDTAEGKLGAVCVEDFWGADERAAILQALDLSLFEPYNTRHYSSEAYRIGPSLNEHRFAQTVSSNYWDAADEAWAMWQSRMPDAQLHKGFLHRLQAVWPGEVRSAASGERRAYWGLVRRMARGTMVHWDDVRTEFAEPIFNDTITSQLSVNVFLLAPEKGGELSVWSRKRDISHERARTGYGYRSEEVVPEPPEVNIKPQAGSAIFFSPTNYHAVSPVRRGDRVAFSLFLGIDSEGDLLLWS